MKLYVAQLPAQRMELELFSRLQRIPQEDDEFVC